MTKREDHPVNDGSFNPVTGACTPATMPHAADIATELSRYVQATHGPLDGEYVERMMDGLGTARAETPADALAAIVWVHGLLIEAIRYMPTEPGQPDPPERFFALRCLGLSAQAIRALEASTGLAAEGFYGDRRQVN